LKNERMLGPVLSAGHGKQEVADNGTLILLKPVFNEKVAVPVT
jgi:hypothetical protein